MKPTTCEERINNKLRMHLEKVEMKLKPQLESIQPSSICTEVSLWLERHIGFNT